MKMEHVYVNFVEKKLLPEHIGTVTNTKSITWPYLDVKNVKFFSKVKKAMKDI